MAANSLDVRAAPNIWDSDVRQMDTIMSALDDVVDRYDCKWSAKRSIKCVGPSIEISAHNGLSAIIRSVVDTSV